MIDPNKSYSLHEIVLSGVMGKTHSTVIRKVLEDKVTNNILKTEITGPIDAKRYHIKGKNLLTYISKKP